MSKTSKQEIQSIVDKFPDNTEVSNEILKILGNKTTKVVLDKDIKSSYYVYLNDTIYLSDRPKNKTNYSRICLIAHECIHSMQSKILQKVNFILSNIEMISFFVAMILCIFDVATKYVFYTYLSIVIISIIPRIILEIDAVLKSVPLSKKYMRGKIEESEELKVSNRYNKYTKLLLPLFILLLIFRKFIKVLVILLFKIYR